jgi:hypothetical protein
MSSSRYPVLSASTSAHALERGIFYCLTFPFEPVK